MSNQSLTIATPIVSIQNGKAFANSRDVAEFFGRRHDNVLQIIDRLECSDAYRLLNYQETADYQKVGFASRVLRTFNMTKDGFVFLVMGFTGRQAETFPSGRPVNSLSKAMTLPLSLRLTVRSTDLQKIQLNYSHLTDRNSDNDHSFLQPDRSAANRFREGRQGVCQQPRRG